MFTKILDELFKVINKRFRGNTTIDTVKMTTNICNITTRNEMIKNIIERMAKNCFQLKAWTMTLVVLIGGLAAKDTERKFIIIAFIPIIVFWMLDTYYLEFPALSSIY